MGEFNIKFQMIMQKIRPKLSEGTVFKKLFQYWKTLPSRDLWVGELVISLYYRNNSSYEGSHDTTSVWRCWVKLVSGKVLAIRQKILSKSTAITYFGNPSFWVVQWNVLCIRTCATVLTKATIAVFNKILINKSRDLLKMNYKTFILLTTILKMPCKTINATSLY